MLLVVCTYLDRDDMQASVLMGYIQTGRLNIPLLVVRMQAW
jgi:hypothetical protein